ncbi:hypothetical protein BGZ68_004863 [Mortierella alpina]|nr:hypothetical protein BGZ68_004863 [Mortierella alpina]
MSESKVLPPTAPRVVTSELQKSSTSVNRLSDVECNSEDEALDGSTGAGGGSTRELANMMDVLAETNIAYDQGQYAVYDDMKPGHEHKSHRFFNNLQYNYNRKRLGHEDSALFPQSPEWHLTTFELEAMEAERENEAGGSGTGVKDMAATEHLAGDDGMAVRPTSFDQVQHLLEPVLPSVVDIRVEPVLDAPRPLSVPLGLASESPVVPRPASSPPRSLTKHTAGEDREQQEAQPQHAQQRRQPLFPPHLARFQSLSPSMMHLPPITLKNLSDEALDTEPNMEPEGNNN